MGRSETSGWKFPTLGAWSFSPFSSTFSKLLMIGEYYKPYFKLGIFQEVKVSLCLKKHFKSLATSCYSWILEVLIDDKGLNLYNVGTQA